MSQSTYPVPGHVQDNANSALAGYVPATMGARFLARLLESLVWGLVVAVALLLAMTAFTGALVLAAILLLASPFAALAVLLTTGATVGNLLMGQRQVSATTGEVAAGATFLKYLLTGVVGTVTCGLGNVALLLTIKPPFNQHWADRAAGIVVIDARRGRVPRRRGAAGDEPFPQVGTAGRTHGLTSVELPQPVISSVPGVLGDPINTTPARDQWSNRPVPVVKDMRSVDAHLTLPPPGDESHNLATTVRRGTNASAAILLDTGEHVPVEGYLLIGRNPASTDSMPGARLIAVADEARSISKTHLAVGPAGSGIWVQDLHSTNGVRVIDAAGSSQQVPPGQRAPVLPGSTVAYGDRTFVVG